MAFLPSSVSSLFQTWNEDAWEHFTSSMPSSTHSQEWEKFLFQQKSIEEGPKFQQEFSATEAIEPKTRPACHVPGCGKDYSRKSDLKNHIKIKHGEEALLARSDLKDKHAVLKKFPCPHAGCPSSCARRCDLLRHLKIKHNDLRSSRKTKVFICREEGCGYKFTKTRSLTHHINSAHRRRDNI